MSNCSNRNTITSVINFSSDIQEFIRPTFEVSGATKIDCDITGLTSGSTGVYLITNESEIDFDFIFNGDNSSFVNKTESKFNFTIHRFNNDTNEFNRLPIFKSDNFEWVDFSSTTILNTTIPIDSLNIDGEYIIKGNFLNKYTTEFMYLLNNSYDTSLFINGDSFGIYSSDRDYYFVVISKPEQPLLGLGKNPPITVNSIVTTSFDLVSGQNQVEIPDSVSDYIVTLNGLVLSEGFDYNISQLNNNSVVTNIITLSSPGKSGDILNVIFIKSGGNNELITKIYDITNPAPSGPTNTQGSDDYFFNTDTNKYELYIDSDPISSSDIVVTINGAVLANNIDYYQSSSNPKRIILEGSIIPGDIIIVYYNSFTNVVGNILTQTPTFAWTITTPPTINNGYFELEVANDDNFTSIVNTGTINYVVGQNAYFLPLSLNANYNDVLYYRVKNIKNYETICGDIIESLTYSDVRKIKVKVNNINNY